MTRTGPDWISLYIIDGGGVVVVVASQYGQ